MNEVKNLVLLLILVLLATSLIGMNNKTTIKEHVNKKYRNKEEITKELNRLIRRVKLLKKSVDNL